MFGGPDDTRMSLRKRKQVVIEKFKGVTESFDDFGITNEHIHKVATKFYQDQHEAYLAKKLASQGPEEPWDIWRILKTLFHWIETFIKFRLGIKFFQLNNKGKTAMDDENIGDEVFDNDEEAKEEAEVIQYSKFTKQIYLGTMFVLLGIGLIVEYVMILGTEKTQTLKYKYHTFLDYNTTEIPRLFPMHQFAYFEKQSVIDRMKCKVADVEEECFNIESTRCDLYPVTTEKFERCNLALYQKLEWNQTQYCHDHYNNLEIWTNTLNPKFPLYWERKYDCLEKAGQPKGKEYCDTMNEKYDGWQIENLFNCYQVNGVEFYEDFCEHKFDVINLPTKLNKESLLYCKARSKIPKDEQFCDLQTELKNPNMQTKKGVRIDCYDSIPIKSKYVCDRKEDFLSEVADGDEDVTLWDKARLADCYKAAGHEVLDQDFCLSQHDKFKDTDGLYNCYFLMDLGIEKDRDYCEWKFVDNSEEKYACMDELGLVKGGDYCYSKFLFASETDDLYSCLESESLPKDSTYCSRKYDYELLEEKKQGRTKDISSKYTCQENNGGIPNNENQCKVLATLNDELGDFSQKLTPHSNVVLSNEVAANEIILNNCAYTKEASDDAKPFWKAEIENSKVMQVKLFNTLNGADQSNLGSAEVWVGGKFCGSLPKAPKLETTISVECAHDDVKGVTGDTVEIRGKLVGTMVVCDVQVFTEADNAVKNSQADEYSQCLTWQDECNTLFTAPEDAENRLNCLNRYGSSFTPEFCIQQHSASSELFAYPLKNKYTCLANKKSKYGKVTVDVDVTECLALGKEYLIQQCLETYESEYESIGFNIPDTFRSYGNKTVSYADIAKAEAAAIAQAEKTFREKYKAQVPVWLKDIQFTKEEVQQYLCSKTDMIFYSNPYNDRRMAPSKEQQEIILNMKCETFEYYDAELEEQQVVIHYYMDDKLDFRKGEDQKIFTVNRTELNQQYFEFSFYKELEFLEVRKNQLYMREQDPKKKVLDVPTIQTTQEYEDFRAYNMSVKLVETLKLNIGVQEMERTILDTAPQKNVYIAASKDGGKQIFGINIEKADYKERILVHEPEVDLRMTSDYTEEEREQPEFKFQTAFQTTFTEMNFKFTYYSLSDMFIELGSIQAIAMGMIAAFMYYIICLFVIDMVKKIQRMHARDRRQNARRKLYTKLPQYKRAIKLLRRKAICSNADEKKILELNQDLEISNVLLEMMMPNYDESDDEEDLKRILGDEAGETPREQPTPRPTFSKKQLDAMDDVQETEEKEKVPLKEKMASKTRLEKLRFQYDELMVLEKKYGSRFAELQIIDANVEVMDDFHEIDKFLEGKANMGFNQVIALFQARLSYFGIYYLNDTIELTMGRVKYLRKQLAEIVKIMLTYQARLLDEVKQERKEKVDHINAKFSVLSEFNNLYNAANYKCVDQKDFDAQVKNLDAELDEIRKMIASGSESKYIIDGMKKRLTVKKAEDPEKVEMTQKINKLHEAIERLCISKKVDTQITKKLNLSIQAQENEQIKSDISKIQKTVEAQEYNPVVNSVSRIVRKIAPRPDFIGELKPELNGLFNSIVDGIEAWNLTLERLQISRDNHHQLYWGEFELQIANLYAFKDEESTLEIAELQAMLNEEMADWNKSRDRMQDMVDKLTKAKKELATLAFN